MTNDLLLAILSMDAYNRGSNPGLRVDATSIGGATVGLALEDKFTSFFAQAYDFGGQKIISYRGTIDIPRDLLFGYSTAAGSYTSPQALEAVQFYQDVAGGGGSLALDQLYSANVWLTGHSLGGGLAGLIASVYGQHAAIFDSMAFSLAASKLYLETTTHTNPADAALGELAYYLGGQPKPIDGSGIGSFQLEGQILPAVAAAPVSITYSLGNNVPLGGFQLHSIALLVIAMYADGAGNGDDWLNGAKYIFPGLYDDNLASKLGLDDTGTGSDSASGKMRTMIAYSTLDDGNVFGNVAVKALLNDTADFGRLITDGNPAGYLQDQRVQTAIGEIVAEYAGLLAANKDTSQANASGILTYTPGSSSVIADFTHDRWNRADTGKPADIVGKDDLINAAIEFSGDKSTSFQKALDTLWSGKTDNIAKLVAAATDDPGITLDAVADGGIGATSSTDGAMMIAGGGGDSLTGGKGNNLLIGGSGDDTLTGGTGIDLMFGGGGKDTFILGQGGSNWIDGGPGFDTAKYQTSDPLTVIVANTNGVIDGTDPHNTNPPIPIIKLTDANSGGQAPATDYLASVEDIKLGTGPNTVNVNSLTKVPYSSTIDLNATSLDSNDTVDFSQYHGNMYLSSAHPVQGAPDAVEIYPTRAFGNGTGLSFTNFNTLILGAGDNKVELYTADDPYLTTIQTGNGENTIVSDIVNLKINLGTGKNIIGHLGMGTIVNTQGTGGNRIIASDDTLLNGLTPTDQIFSGGHLLRGAVGQIGSEDPWIVGPDGTRYGLNFQGDLVIEDGCGDKTYVSNYHGGPDLPFSQQTAGIFVGEAKVFALRILDLLRPHIGNMMTLFKLGNEILYTKTGQTFFNSDPLVFDLGGTGVSLTPLSSVAPMLDLRGNGFGVHSGWVGVNQGILVLQQAGHTGTPTISEMFGGPGATGLAALAQYDTNHDGVIDANDAVYSQLRMWVDRNGNGTVDSGELETLAQAGVTSISLAATAQTADTLAGNTVTATGSFTRSDGTSGAIADVSFNVDTFHSTYLGDTTVSTAAAAMPNLKGYGTLPDLRVAMTLDPTLIDTINANLPNLAVPNLAALRRAA